MKVSEKLNIVVGKNMSFNFKNKVENLLFKFSRIPNTIRY